MTMRFLLGLAIMQSLVLFFLCVRVLEVDSQTDDLANKFDYTTSALETARSTNTSGEAITPVHYKGPSLAQIRDVVKSEITLLAEQTKASAQSETRQASLAIQNARSPEEIRSIQAAISSELNLYIQDGRAGEIQIASLQSKIAKLPPDQQKQMLGKLVGAINSGQIDARL